MTRLRTGWTPIWSAEGAGVRDKPSSPGRLARSDMRLYVCAGVPCNNSLMRRVSRVARLGRGAGAYKNFQLRATYPRTCQNV